MSWALQFDGVNDYTTLPTLAGGAFGDRLNTAQDWYLEFEFNRQGSDGYVHRILDDSTGSDSILFRASDGLFRLNTTSAGQLNWNGVPMPSGVFVKYKIQKLVGTVDYELFVDIGAGFVSQGVKSGITAIVRFDVIGRNGTSGYINGQLTYFKYISASNPSQDINLDATASSHAAGTPIWTDVIGGNNATGVNFPTDGSAWVDLGGGGISLSVTETGPSFTESINTTLTAAINVSITESGPNFTESIAATLTALTISADITEIGPSFTESINATVTTAVGISVSIAEVGPSFTESIGALLGVNLNTAITEQGPSFSESATVSAIKEITLLITETGPSFTESINVTLPITVTVNPKNVIQVKRKSNTVIIEGSNI